MIELSALFSPDQFEKILPKKRSKEEQAIAEAKKQKAQINAAAIATKSRILTQALISGWTSWSQVEKDMSFEFPEMWKSIPYSYPTLVKALDFYVSSAVDVFLKVEETKTITQIIHDTGGQFGDRTLRPRQYKCMKLVVNGAEQRRSNAFYLPLPTGAGKTVIAGALFNYAQNHWKDKMRSMPFERFVFLTKKAVLEKTRREFIKCGVKGVGTDVKIWSYPMLSSSKLDDRFEETEIMVLGNKTKAYKYIGAPPEVMVIDEGQVVKKLGSESAKKLLAIIEACPDTIFVWTSATPAVCMQDLQLFVISTRLKFMGQPVNRETWPAYVSQFTLEPRVADDAAARDFHKSIGEDVWIRPPADKRKYKLTNKIEVIQMTDERERRAYAMAEENYLEALRRAGKDADAKKLAMAKFTILRICEETIKSKYFASKGLELWKQGFAPCVAVSYQGTVRETVLAWTKAGIKRDNICVIWGGKRQIKPSDLLDDNEFISVLTRKMNKEAVEPELLRKFKYTAEHREQRLRRDETQEEQNIREAELKELGLTKPSDAQQQKEIDEFQEGKRQFCIYTFGRGGTGIDLDDQLGPPFCRPRRTLSTICYYGEEFVQAAGRTAREGTVTDVEFTMLFFAGTIAANHVAPILVPKLRNIQALAAGSTDLASVLEGRIADQVAAEEIKSTSTEQDGELLVDDGDDEDGED